MKLKEFLKPTTETIMWFLIIFILFIPFMVIDNGTMCIQTPCPNQLAASLAIYWFALIKGTFIYSINYMILTLGIISSYILGAAFNLFLNKKKNGKIHRKKSK